MPERLRDRYLRAVFEAIIEYNAEGGELHLVSHIPDETLVMTLTLDSNEDFQTKLSEILAKREALA